MSLMGVDVIFGRMAKGQHCGLCFSVTLLVGLFALFLGSTARAQDYGGRAASVEVAPAKQEILSIFTDVQGRVVAGPATAITAATNAITQLESLKLGDRVASGQIIAIQDSATLRRQLSASEIRLADARIRLQQAIQADNDEVDRLQRRRETLLLVLGDARRTIDDLTDDIAHEKGLLDVNQRQFDLLDTKARRARELSARNALPLDAADTALGVSLNAQQQVLVREATITRKQAQLEQARNALERSTLDLAQLDRDLAGQKDFLQSRIKAEIRQLEQDIADIQKDIDDTRLRSTLDGQIIFLAALKRGYSREGDVIARLVNPDEYEVEAEIPVAHLGYVMAETAIRAHDLQGGEVFLKPRVALPFQNARTGTQTVRFSVDGALPKSAMADNAVLVLKVPTTSPAPVVTVPKDAVLPVVGGHIVYVAEAGVAVKKVIRLGDAVGESFVVLEGLEGGVDVIVRGNEALSDGKKIKVGGEEQAERPKGPAGEAWTLNWTTQRGPASADLIVGTEKSFFNGEETAFVRAGNSVNFNGKLYPPFGVLDLEFQGTIDGETMAGKVTLRGLPNGREPVLDFTGSKAAK